MQVFVELSHALSKVALSDPAMVALYRYSQRVLLRLVYETAIVSFVCDNKRGFSGAKTKIGVHISDKYSIHKYFA